MKIKTTEIQTDGPSPLLAKLRAQRRTLTRLQFGDVVLGLGAQKYRVDFVNESRARIVPLSAKVREFVAATGKHAGQCRTFVETPRGIDISPNSEVEILERAA